MGKIFTPKPPRSLADHVQSGGAVHYHFAQSDYMRCPDGSVKYVGSSPPPTLEAAVARIKAEVAELRGKAVSSARSQRDLRKLIARQQEVTSKANAHLERMAMQARAGVIDAAAVDEPHRTAQAAREVGRALDRELAERVRADEAAERLAALVNDLSV
ncbi:hypothetical protein J4G52_11825 [Burkholderia cenocepacia]|uniref:hypothetical protein n=1 Tax=Burkholderia cenocepacia TaxID=95486 RepID=UPI001AA0E2F7|nr:hypothetical protein [Burkholderia cenocepacia]MBO1854229.1 hypothetical protein [Burkholderia cenocepacia]MDR5647311.1 hypothetical protein [Burkholderia cenocepacia]